MSFSDYSLHLPNLVQDPEQLQEERFAGLLWVCEGEGILCSWKPAGEEGHREDRWASRRVF